MMKEKAAAWLGARAIPEWRKMHRMATIWVAAFWGCMLFAAAAWTQLQGQIPDIVFWIGGFAIFGSIAVARVTKQPGLDQ